MARNYAALTTAIWKDPTFTGLAVADQWLFLLLITQPDLTPDGTIALRPRRWSRYAAGVTEETVRASLLRLTAANLIAVEEEIDELRLLYRPTIVRSRTTQRRAQPAPRERPAPAVRAPAPPASITLPRHRPKVSAVRMARTRLAVYQRADFRCQECGMHFPPSDGYDGRYCLAQYATNRPRRRNGRHPLYCLELDHVVPYSRGGRFEIDNLQALCSGCNVRKGAQIR